MTDPLDPAPNQHLAVRRSGKGWNVDLITPGAAHRTLRVSLARCATRVRAIEAGERMAAILDRPLKVRRAKL